MADPAIVKQARKALKSPVIVRSNQTNGEVTKSIRGTATLATNEMQAKLGPVAWQVWCRLLHWRDQNGITKAHNRSLAEALNMSDAKIRRACSRLHHVGLLWFLKKGPNNCAFRLVLGGFIDGKIFLPPEIFERLTAGENQKSPAQSPAQNQKSHAQSRAQSHAQKVRTTFDPMRTTSREKCARLCQKARTTFGPLKKNNEAKTDSCKEKSAPEERLKKKKREQNNFQPSLHDPAGSCVGAVAPTFFDFFSSAEKNFLSCEKNQDLSSIHWGVLQPGGGVLPKEPSAARLKIPKIPPPPRLDQLEAALFEPATIEQKVDWLLLAYRGAHLERLGEENFSLRKGNVKNSRHWKQLKQTVSLFEQEGIAPAAWVLFSFDCWDGESSKLPAPPLQFVFSPARIEKNLNWFTENKAGYMRKRFLFSQEAKDVQQRWQNMLLQLNLLPKELEKRNLLCEDNLIIGATLIRDNFFPGGTDAWFAKVREKSFDDQRRIDQWVSQGEFWWV